jgi:hypothetical protein
MVYAGVRLEELTDDLVLTQYGSRVYPPGEPFRRRPREGKETEISLLAGRIELDEAARMVNRRRREGAHPGDGVRYTTVGRLLAAGFSPTLTPSKLLPNHVSVALGGEENWTETVCARFDGCFTETAWKEESE